MEIGEYGTAYKAETFRYAVKIIKIEGDKCVGRLLSSPGQLTTFNKKYFIPRGHAGGMMLLEKQISDFEKMPINVIVPTLSWSYDNYSS